MDHFPIFVNLNGKRVVVSGASETAVAKLRLLLKTKARISVYGADPVAQIRIWATERKLELFERPLAEADLTNAVLLYGANDELTEDRRVAKIGRNAGAMVNIVDNLGESQFITPAIVDRDPVTVAIGTEGAAPVLARQIKAQMEEALPPSLGALARIGQGFRKHAEALPMGRRRRDFWSRFYFRRGPQALARGGEIAVKEDLGQLLDDCMNTRAELGHVALVGAGPGDPQLLTLAARTALHQADVVIHDQLVSPEILELARREAIVVETGKRGFGPSWKQANINHLMVEHAAQGRQVVRLKSGDPTIFGRLDEEMDALDNAGINWSIVPGITAASAAAASMGASLTKRGRNSSLRILTGHDMKGFAEHDWRDLAEPEATAAIYMGKRAAQFIRGRLLMYGAPENKPVTIVENASRLDQKIMSTTLLALPDLLESAKVEGPAILFLGMSPRAALDILDTDHANTIGTRTGHA